MNFYEYHKMMVWLQGKAKWYALNYMIQPKWHCFNHHIDQTGKLPSEKLASLGNLKPLNMIVLWLSERIQVPINWAPMKATSASLSDDYTSDRRCFRNTFFLVITYSVITRKWHRLRTHSFDKFAWYIFINRYTDNIRV